ncbi:hypothetical protein MKW98_032471 [Papaver atlanticum]|uniref:Protein NRT1/ PTR FAMILY 5.2-like n=1 Tax=Papaver atlanticum TaxID=357466 RepID=A0AAD4SW53_9MAGN|nr:hypothetical protein MKW98_032471 [Papaver atlanticum]
MTSIKSRGVVAEETLTELHTQDGSVDLKGNPILRSKRGVWKACSFLVVYEVFERFAFYGISSNLILYLTKKLHQGTVTAANNVTNWNGTIWLAPMVGAYIADAHLGRYWTFLIASLIHVTGMCLLTLSVSIEGLKPPSCALANVAECKEPSALQLSVFFTALYMFGVGAGGTKANMIVLGADQFDEFYPKEKLQKFSFFNWWMFTIFFGALMGNTFLVYIQDNVGWSLGYGIPTIGLAIAVIVFLAGTPYYRHKLPMGSPFTTMFKVIFAALRKWRLPLPVDSQELYELNLEEYSKEGRCKIAPTNTLRFLNKAAIKTDSMSTWMLILITQVEETKQMLCLFPIMITSILPSTMVAQVNTLFVKQGTTLDRGLGNFQIPPASLAGFVTISMLIFVIFYDRFFVPIMRRWTKNPRGVTLLQRMGLGLVLHIVVMVAASLTERWRLSVARQHGIVQNGGVVPLSIFILLPQFILMGVADAVFEVVRVEFFYDQAPESMKSLGTSYYMTSLGVGSFLSSFLLKTVADITQRNHRKGWILNNLNDSHLDYYYWFFAILNALNFILFLFMAKFYVYKAEVSDSMEVLKKDLENDN